ncbi:hypothetical protein [Fodinibius sp. SL11]|uniref:hypothetical protein n=1 Tax=Fodinibius sp. SL11 TaxID=3425690 RepID=UPI003F8831EC
MLFAFMVLLPRYLWISNYPDTFFLPRIGITLFFSGFPDIYFFYILNFLLIASLLSLLVGYKTFYTSIAVGMLFFLGAAWEYSFGKVNHDIPLIIIPLILASSWGNPVSKVKNTQNGKSWAVPLFALLMGLAMLTAAIPKIVSGWLDPSTSALAGHLVRNYFVAERETILATYLLSQNHFYLLKFLDYGTILIESAFIFSVFSLRNFRLVCALACFFHFGVQLTMGISFSTNLLAYALFVNWAYLYNFESVKHWLNRLEGFFKSIGFLKLFIVSIPVWAFYSFIGNPFAIDFGLQTILGGNFINTIIMLGAVAISARYFYRILMNFSIRNELDLTGTSTSGGL